MARKRANRETSDSAKEPNQRQRRHKRGEGPVYQRASDGLWVAVLGHGVVGGKRRRTAFYAKKSRGRSPGSTGCSLVRGDANFDANWERQSETVRTNQRQVAAYG
jgi:hypothetical protein